MFTVTLSRPLASAVERHAGGFGGFGTIVRSTEVELRLRAKTNDVRRLCKALWEIAWGEVEPQQTRRAAMRRVHQLRAYCGLSRRAAPAQEAAQ